MYHPRNQLHIICCYFYQRICIGFDILEVDVSLSRVLAMALGHFGIAQRQVEIGERKSNDIGHRAS